ncbi:hypothetical protein L2E82_45318 [Cichorium intybus]|uniref:Uncharacterized protein n=1 Tax=Cichorium intybus TaxID=13427 RepID=A0ACB8ZT72_CICIN|nr:hypothetical protein L2E82_45318 [Cichorium intybus]
MTTRVRKWNRYDGFQRTLNDRYHQKGVFLNGSLYFATREPFSVVSFDLHTGKWETSEVDLPAELTFIRLAAGNGNGAAEKRLFMIGGTGRNWISRNMKVWELYVKGRKWTEVKSVPDMMCRKFGSICYHNYEHVYCFWHQAMAEIVVSTFLTVVFEKLTSEALKKIARAKGIDSELKKLKRSLDQIQALLNDASQKEITDEAVKEWLNGLQHLAYDIDDLLDDLATEAMHRQFTEESGATTSKVRKLIPTCCRNFSLSTRLQCKLDDISTRLQELVEAKENLGLKVVKNEKPKIKRYEACLVDPSGIVGRKGEKKALVQQLLGGKDESCNQNFSVVPIVGMGGVGKTTLARLLYDEKEVKDHFEVRAWVCVSDEFDITNISKIIYQSVTGESKEFADLNLLQEALKEKLMKKLFLIVLDDVWSESYDDWDKLVGPFLVGAPGSKVIMTTRKEQLLRKLGYAHVDPLQSLSHDDALSLFAQNALGVDNFDSHPTLRPHGEGFVKKCDGLPLALRTLGRLLRTKTDEEEWTELLDSEIWRLGNRDEIVPALRLSYHDLSASLKLLFAYCSLFPKDYEFEKEELILLWMAEGFLHTSTTSKSMERLGHEYFEELLSRSFFQHLPGDKSLFVMHDLMNDLAMSVAGDFFSRLDIQRKKEFRKEASEKFRHISFECDDFMGQERFEAFKGATKVRTFLALYPTRHTNPGSFSFSNKILANLVQELPLLRVLCLSYLSISEVPESIGSMKHLRYLNLCRTHIRTLPENVCSLYNLETLIVYRCSFLTKLPENFSRLKNLRHFDFRCTPSLNKMPIGIAELKSLRTLSKIIIEGDNGFSMTNLKNLKYLQGKISIEGLEKVQIPMHTQEVNFSQKRISELELEWSNVFDGSRKETLEMEVLCGLKPHKDTLIKLGIVSYGGKEFPNWVGDPSFLRLARVSIRGCKKCTSLPLFGQLPSLKKLYLQGMDKVKVVGSELPGTALAFPSLEILSFRSLSGWEVWSGTVFPRLHKLLITDCPNLVQISLEALPSLRDLTIDNCGYEVLTSLIRVTSSVTQFSISSLRGLTDQLWRGVIEYLGTAEEIKIESCNEIRYLWESEAKSSKVLVNLRKLEVRDCSNLVSLGENADNCGSSLTSLRILEVLFCHRLERCSCPNSIETLKIFCCHMITSVSFPSGAQKLKSVTIESCNKLLENVVGTEDETGGMLINSSMRMLESLKISRLPNLKSIIDLSRFIYLTKLEITDCSEMASFPDHELPNLTMLKELTIQNCQGMDPSFPCGLWPPNLHKLWIGGLNKPISEWGPQNFPSTLVDLELTGGGTEDVSNFSQLSHLLPPSLTSLNISFYRFSNSFCFLKFVRILRETGTTSTGDSQHCCRLRFSVFRICRKKGLVEEAAIGISPEDYKISCDLKRP